MELAELLQMEEQDAWAYFGRLRRRWEKKREDPNDVLIEAARLMEKRRKTAARKKPSERGVPPDRRPYERELQLPLWLVAGLWIIGDLAPVRNPAGHPPAAAEDQRVVRGSRPQGQTLEARTNSNVSGLRAAEAYRLRFDSRTRQKLGSILPPSRRAPPRICGQHNSG